MIVLVKRLLSPGLLLDEAAHLVGIAGDDHDDAVAIVLHEFQQRVDRFLAEVVTRAAGARRQRIGFVDEQDAVERLAAFVEGLGAVCPT